MRHVGALRGRLPGHIAAELAELGAEHWALCHCSAGVGRTGTFIGLVRLLRTLPSLQDEPALDAAVTQAIEAMRERRLWMVKTDIEYATIYAALLLQLRNPHDAEFELTWPLKQGRRAPLSAPPAALSTALATAVNSSSSAYFTFANAQAMLASS